MAIVAKGNRLIGMTPEQLDRIHARLWSKADCSGGAKSCWNWQRGHDGNGRGQINIKGKWLRAARVAYELTHGNLPSGMLVCHECDNPRCINPAHLFLGSPAVNNSDRSQKGRTRNGDRRGEGNGNNKLNAAQVQEIRWKHATGAYTLKQLGKEYNVHFDLISKIVKHRIWKNIGATG